MSGGPLIDYNPTFMQPVKGSFQYDTHFVALNVGTDAYVTEREVNELQWIQTEKAAEALRQIAYSGVLTIDDDSNLKKCFKIINNDKDHLNGFELPPFDTICNGYITHHELYNGTKKKNIPVRLPNPPITGFRHDFVYIEFWFAELKEKDKVPKFGYNINNPMDYNIIDERINDETSRRIQLQWTISHYEDYDDWCDKGFIKPNGQPNEKIHPLAQTGYLDMTSHYEPVDYDPYLYRAGNGLSPKQKIHTVDGYIYAIPLFNIFRRNNDTYSAAVNPYGGPDYVAGKTITVKRPDGKYSNIIYDDDIKDLRHLSPMSEKQYNKIYITLTEYYNNETILRNKLLNMTEQYKNEREMLRNYDIDLPSIHDKEIYGHEMYHQWGLTNGAGFDPLDKDRKIVYKKHIKYYVGQRLKNKNYCVLPTLIDYDAEDEGSLGDFYIQKMPNKFRFYNTGAKNLRMNFEALLVDDDMVRSGVNVFSGMDGTPINMPFKLDSDRYFVQITPLDNTNGRNGEIFVKFVEKQIYVYNTGLSTSTLTGSVTSTVGNKFQWVVIDMQHPNWKNIDRVLVTLNGHDGVEVASHEYGEKYRLTLGTPIIDSSMVVEQGSIGETFADVDEDNLFTVYNTGTTGAQVQCLIFDDIDYVDFYDTLKTTQVVDVDDIKNIVVNK